MGGSEIPNSLFQNKLATYIRQTCKTADLHLQLHVNCGILSSVCRNSITKSYMN